VNQIWSNVQNRFPEANLFQSPAWGEVNRLVGHKVKVEHFEDVAWCQMIIKNAKRGRYIEIPCGPLIDWQDTALTRRLFALIKKTAKAEKCAFVRFRPQLTNAPEHQALLEPLGLRRAPMHLAAEHTVIIDLTKSEEELMSAMRRQTRYEVRRATKLGITIEHGHSEALFREFHAVQTETAARQHFFPPNLDTLLAERTALNQNGTSAEIYVAKSAEGQPIAYGLILTSGREAEYYEAASTELNHHLPGAYALEWQVMRDLKKQGIERYNLWGIAPTDPKTGKPQKNHRYSGVTTFKTGFGGKIIQFIPAQDLVVSPLRYAFNWVIEIIRKKKRHL